MVGTRNKEVIQEAHRIQTNITVEQESIDQRIIRIHHLIIMEGLMDILIIQTITCMVDTKVHQWMQDHIIHLQLILINKSARKYGKVHHTFDHSMDQKEWMKIKKNLLISSNKTPIIINTLKIFITQNKKMTKS